MNTKIKENLLEDNLEENLAFIRNLKAANTVEVESVSSKRNYRRTTETNNQFFGVTTSREFALLFRGYTVETIGDIHDIISIKFEDELHYYLSHKLDRNNINMDTYINLAAYRDLIDDLSVYLNVEV